MNDDVQKLAAPPVAGGQSRPERRTIGTVELAFFVVAAAGPLLVVAGLTPLSIMFGGIAAGLAQLIAGAVLAVFAVGFTRMAVAVKIPGGFFAYIGRGLGKPAGGGAAMLAAGLYASATIAQLGILGSFAHGSILRMSGADVPWPVLSFTALLLIAFLGYREISLSAKVLGVALFAEIAVLLVIASGVIARGGGPDGLTLEPFNPVHLINSPSIGAMFVIAFSAFIGFESTAVYTEEARDARRTVPRATMLAIGFLAIFYTLLTWAGIVAFGTEGAVAVASADPVGYYFALADTYVGHEVTAIMEGLLVSSAFAAVLAFHNAASRYVFVQGRERLLPGRLAKLHPKHGSPSSASLLLTILSVVVVGTFAISGADPYLNLFLWAGAWPIVAVSIMQALCSLAVLVFFIRNRGEARRFSSISTLVAPLVAAVGLIIAAFLMITNFDVLTGGAPMVNVVTLSLIPVLFAIGLWRTLFIKQCHPKVYRNLIHTADENNSVE